MKKIIWIEIWFCWFYTFQYCKKNKYFVETRWVVKCVFLLLVYCFSKLMVKICFKKIYWVVKIRKYFRGRYFPRFCPVISIPRGSSSPNCPLFLPLSIFLKKTCWKMSWKAALRKAVHFPRRWEPGGWRGLCNLSPTSMWPLIVTSHDLLSRLELVFEK